MVEVDMKKGNETQFSKVAWISEREANRQLAWTLTWSFAVLFLTIYSVLRA